MMAPVQDFQSLPINTQMSLIGHFIKLASDSYRFNASVGVSRSRGLLHYVANAQNLIQELGIQERDLQPATRDMAQELKKHFLLLTKRIPSPSSSFGPVPGSGSTGGSDVEENVHLLAAPFLMLTSSPADLSMRMGNSIFTNIAHKQLRKSYLESPQTNVGENRIEINESNEKVLTMLEQENNNSKKRLECLVPGKLETLKYTSEILKSQAASLREQASGTTKHVDTSEIQALLGHHAALKDKNEKLTTELETISHKDALPPNLTLTREILKERKSYLDSLIKQITVLETCDNMSISMCSSVSSRH